MIGPTLMGVTCALLSMCFVPLLQSVTKDLPLMFDAFSNIVQHLMNHCPF